MFDFDKALAQSKSMFENKNLFAIVMGSSGGGKSYLLGTLGVKTLYLYMSGESHGAQSSAIEGGANILPYCLDYIDGKHLTPDETYNHLLAVLSDTAAIKKNKIKAIALDGCAELETIIRDSKAWAKLCIDEKGKHNNWLETDATCDMFRKVIETAKDLQREADIHFMTTSLLDVRAVGDMGEITEASPRLRGARVADFLLRQFGEVLVVGRMQNDEKAAYKLQFMTKMSKTAKEAGGGTKLLNFSPRITGVKVEDLPPFMTPSLATIFDIKKAGGVE